MAEKGKVSTVEEMISDAPSSGIDFSEEAILTLRQSEKMINERDALYQEKVRELKKHVQQNDELSAKLSGLPQDRVSLEITDKDLAELEAEFAALEEADKIKAKFEDSLKHKQSTAPQTKTSLTSKKGKSGAQR